MDPVTETELAVLSFETRLTQAEEELLLNTEMRTLEQKRKGRYEYEGEKKSVNRID